MARCDSVTAFPPRACSIRISAGSARAYRSPRSTWTYPNTAHVPRRPSWRSPSPIAYASGSIALPALRGRDHLTGLLDRDAFDAAARPTRMPATSAYRRPATVAIIELDGLDRLVERLGPDAADRVVPALADTIARCWPDAPTTSPASRPGRFGVLLPETDEVAAINYVERDPPRLRAVARVGRDRRSAWPSAGRARPATRVCSALTRRASRADAGATWSTDAMRSVDRDCRGRARRRLDRRSAVGRGPSRARGGSRDPASRRCARRRRRRACR